MIVFGVWLLSIILIIHTIVAIYKFAHRDYSVLAIILNNLAVFLFILYGTISSLNEGRIQKVNGYLNNQESIKFIFVISLYLISFNSIYTLIKRTPFSIKKYNARNNKIKLFLFLAISHVPFCFDMD